MPDKTIFVPSAVNEEVKDYRPGSTEREEIKKALDEVYSNVLEIPMYIGGKWIKSEKKSLRLSPEGLFQSSVRNSYK